MMAAVLLDTMDNLCTLASLLCNCLTRLAPPKLALTGWPQPSFGLLQVCDNRRRPSIGVPTP